MAVFLQLLAAALFVAFGASFGARWGLFAAAVVLLLLGVAFADVDLAKSWAKVKSWIS